MPSQAALTLPRPGASARRGPHLDTAAALIMEIAREVRDPSVAEDRILRLLNRALLDAAGRVRLPGLFTENTVVLDPGAQVVDLPADYHHGLAEVVCLSARRRLFLASGLEELASRGGPGVRVGGKPLAAAAIGAKLFVRPACDAPAVLLVRYFRLPTPMEADTDRPDGLPAHLAPELLVAGVCRDLFEGLEEGAAGAKTQTGRFEARFETAMARLAEFAGTRQDMDAPVPDVLGFGHPGVFL